MRRSLAAVLVSVSALDSTAAGPAAPQNLAHLVGGSQAILIGKIASGSTVNGATSATVAVERTVKGSLQPGSVVTLVWPHLVRHVGVAQLPRKRILVFAAGTQGQLMVVPATLGQPGVLDAVFVLPDQAGTPPAASVSVLDQVILELLGAVEQGGLGREGAVVDLVAAFRGSRSPVLRSAFVRLSQNPQARLKTLGMRGRIVDGDAQALDAIEREYGSSGALADGTLLEEIKFYWPSPHPIAVKALGRLAAAPSAHLQLRIAAAAALARMHTREALPYLGTLLDNTDRSLQTCGVGGMAMFANNVPIGGHHPAPGDWKYRTDETIARSAFDPSVIAARYAYYLGFWRSWWSAHRAELE